MNTPAAMNPPATMQRAAAAAARRLPGFTLVELLIAITVAIFLVGGALTIVQSTRSTFATQSALAQFQDNARLAVSFMTEVVESAGYYPSPQTNNSALVLPSVNGSFAAGQAIFGTYGAAAPGDSIIVRFGAGLNDNVFNCRGGTNTSVAPYDTFTNKFYVKTVNGTSQLWCTFTNAAGVVGDVPLVNNVTNLSIYYGIKRNVVDTGSCTDTYLNASQMVFPADWNAVCSVQVTFTFVNPVNTSQTINITRVIAVMNAAGVNS